MHETASTSMEDLISPVPLRSGILRRPVVHILAIALLGFLVYSNTFDVPFVFDDLKNIVENPNVRSLRNIPSMFTEVKGPSASRPLTLATFAVNYAVGGDDTFLYHLLNMVLHLINAVLLYTLVVMTAGLLKRKGEDIRLVALFSAFIFVAHPVQTESVTYIVTRSILLATTFYLLGIILFIRAAEERRGRAVYTAALFLVSLLGMASREDFVTFPVMLLLFDFFFLSGLRAREVVGRYRIHLPVISALLYLAYLSLSYQYEGVGHAITKVPAAHYLMTQFKVHWTYLRLFLFPVGQNLDYDYPVARTIFELSTFISFVGYFGLWTLGICFVKKRPVVSFLLLWFMITLTPASSVVPLDDVIFEHRVYLPSAGAAAAVVFPVFMLPARWGGGRVRRAAVPALLTVIIMFSAMSYARNSTWGEEFSLWGDTVGKSPGKARPHYNLGWAYDKQGLYDRALREYRSALGLNPRHVNARNNLGILYVKQGLYEEAVSEFKVAVSINPGDAELRNNLRLAYESMVKGGKRSGRHAEEHIPQ
jgi:hypothetical protein